MGDIDARISDSASTGHHGSGRPRLALLLPDLSGGGAERISVNLANELDARGYRVDMVLLRAEGQLLPLLRPGVRVVNLNVRRSRWVLLPLVRYLNVNEPIVLLACMWPLTVLAVLARTISRVRFRLVLAEHQTWSASEFGSSSGRLRWLSRTMRLAFPHADARVAVSEGAADDLARLAGLPRSSFNVLYNPVAAESATLLFETVRPPEAWWLGSHRRVLAVGRLVKNKDFPTLLRAFARMREGGNGDARLLILGDGPERSSLEALARELGIASVMHMPGFVDNTTPYYQRTDLYVLSSTAEGLPTVVIEALAAGARIVCTDCRSGPREILAGGKFGRLVPVGDVDALAEAMALALEEEPDHAALRVRAQDFSIARSVDAYERLLLGDKMLRRGDEASSMASST